MVVRRKSVFALGAFGMGLLLLSTPASLAQDAIDGDARQVLMKMSTYLGGLTAFSTEIEIDFEVVDLEGQKLQFISSGSLAVKRPGQLHLTRKGAVMDAEVFLADGQLTVYGKNLNGYLQMAEQGSIAQAVDTLRSVLDIGAPGAAFIVPDPAKELLTEGTRGAHIGMTTVGGRAVHHLAFRNDTVDWQIWITDSDQALPVKYIITNKWVAGAPQYTLHFSNWDVAPTLADGRFTFTPSSGAEKLESLTVNPIGEIVPGGE